MPNCKLLLRSILGSFGILIYATIYIGFLSKAHCQEILETKHDIETIWQQCLKEYKTIEDWISGNRENFSEDEILIKNKLLPNQGGLRVRGINGTDWVGEIRICTIPKNVERGLKPYMKIGLITRKDNKNKIFYYPETKRTLEYLNLGGDWLGYSIANTANPPKIVEK